MEVMAFVSPKIFLFVITIFVAASIIMLTSNNMVSAQCEGNMQGLMEQCARYVQKSGPKTAPSQGCCDVVKTVDLACVCHHITDQVEQIISMEKSAYIAQMCGKQLAHGTKCGSYTVP